MDRKFFYEKSIIGRLRNIAYRLTLHASEPAMLNCDPTALNQHQASVGWEQVMEAFRQNAEYLPAPMDPEKVIQHIELVRGPTSVKNNEYTVFARQVIDRKVMQSTTTYLAGELTPAWSGPLQQIVQVHDRHVAQGVEVVYWMFSAADGAGSGAL